MNAASKGFVELARLLLQRGADPSIKNNFGNTAYDLAAQSENTILCQLIVKHLSSSSLLSPSSSCLVCVFENQRAPLFSTVYSDSNLISKQDPPPWSLISFNPNNNPNSTPVASLSSIPLPTAAFWLTDWKVDKRFQIGMSTSGSSSLIGGEGGTVDEDGWMYARTFPTSSSSSSYSSKLEEWSATPPQMGYFGGVRRRMWIRVWNKHLNEPETYIEIAMRRLHVTVPVGADLFGGIAEEAEETQLDILKDVIQGLLDGIKGNGEEMGASRSLILTKLVYR